MCRLVVPAFLVAWLVSWPETNNDSLSKNTPKSYCKQCRASGRDQVWLDTMVIVPRYSSHLHDTSHHHGYTIVLYIHLNKRRIHQWSTRERESYWMGYLSSDRVVVLGKLKRNLFSSANPSIWEFEVVHRVLRLSNELAREEERPISSPFRSLHFSYCSNIRNHPRIVLRSFHWFGLVSASHNPRALVFLDGRSCALWTLRDTRVFSRDFHERVWRVPENYSTKPFERTTRTTRNVDVIGCISSIYLLSILTNPFIEDGQTTMAVEFDVFVMIAIVRWPGLLDISSFLWSSHLQTFDKGREILGLRRWVQFNRIVEFQSTQIITGIIS